MDHANCFKDPARIDVLLKISAMFQLPAESPHDTTPRPFIVTPGAHYEPSSGYNIS